MEIKEIREQTGLSQVEFCKRYGIPKGTLCHWESGERKPPLYVLNLLEKVVEKDKKKKNRKELSRTHNLRPFLLKSCKKLLIIILQWSIIKS